jgi:NADH-ubiquinone oxidoreductase chain 6
MKNLLLNILAFGAIFSSLLVITSTNPVLAVIYLISVFFNVAGYLILLGVEFIGISYILLYVGAITVLFLFVIMMINIKLTDILETGSQYTQNFPLALAIGSLFIFILFTILPFQNNNVSIITMFFDYTNTINSLFLSINDSDLINVLTTFNPYNADVHFSNFLHIEAIGQNLYTYGAALLLICSILLLLAMVATIFISRRSRF